MKKSIEQSFVIAAAAFGGVMLGSAAVKHPAETLVVAGSTMMLTGAAVYGRADQIGRRKP